VPLLLRFSNSTDFSFTHNIVHPLEIREGVVTGIRLRTQYPLELSDVISKYGDPEGMHSFFSPDEGHPGPASILSWLYYPSQGLMLAVHVEVSDRRLLPESPVLELQYQVPVESVREWSLFEEPLYETYPWSGYGVLDPLQVYTE
jgi:hypothetical protein